MGCCLVGLFRCWAIGLMGFFPIFLSLHKRLSYQKTFLHTQGFTYGFGRYFWKQFRAAHRRPSPAQAAISCTGAEDPSPAKPYPQHQKQADAAECWSQTAAHRRIHPPVYCHDPVLQVAWSIWPKLKTKTIKQNDPTVNSDQVITSCLLLDYWLVLHFLWSWHWRFILLWFEKDTGKSMKVWFVCCIIGMQSTQELHSIGQPPLRTSFKPFWRLVFSWHRRSFYFWESFGF